MNSDQLIKLIKLANNNPNENEANSAARKVCKIIEENKFSLIKIEPKTVLSKSNKQAAKAEWLYNAAFRIYINLRTGEVMTPLEFNDKLK